MALKTIVRLADQSAGFLTNASASTTYQAKVANVSDAEIGYLDGVTSGIQSQIDSKLSISSASTTYATKSAPIITGGATISGNLALDSGRITAASQPSFMATRSANVAISSGGVVVPLDSVSYGTGTFNNGGHYNTSTYRFTAPVSGRYLFNFNANVYSATGVIFNTGIRINGSQIIYGTRFTTNVSGDNDGCVAAIVSISANDYVEPFIYVSSGMTISASNAWNSFSGTLLS